MKIKELHMRNIASIESADIDFEKGITERGSTDPANIFLISGDTGTGKSVILDGIAMALYKTTPRINDVANKLNNVFADDNGESIKINSIEQYSRLGISDKDECYSELVFEGNDGVEYHARLDLGFLMTNKDAEGKRHLKYRTPKWTVKVGNEDWTKVDSKSGQPILDAVGLTFSQFGRMAMLAQGQFATFLTGDKSEREKILEQLTNTEKFSVYGTAISNLFKAAERTKSDAERVFNVYREQLLPAEEEQRLRDEVMRLDNDRKELTGRMKCVQEKLAMVNAIELQKTQMNETCSKIEKVEQQLKEEKAKTAGLEEAVKVCQANVASATNAVKEKQDAIDIMQKERNSLNPKAVNAEIVAGTNRRNELGNLKTRIGKLEAMRVAAVAAHDDLVQDNEKLKVLKGELDDAQKVYDVAASAASDAHSLLATMQMSVNETLTELRKRLQRDKADTCPLCGQPLVELHVEEDFRHMMSPLQKREEEAKARLKSATEVRDKSKSRHDTLKGAMTTKQKAYDKATKEIATEDVAIKAEAGRLGLDNQLPIADQIIAAIDKVATQIAALVEKQRLAEAIQARINEMTDQKKPLDKELSQAERQLSVAQNAVELNRKDILKREQDLVELTSSRESLKEKLKAVIDEANPQMDTKPLIEEQEAINRSLQSNAEQIGGIQNHLRNNDETRQKAEQARVEFEKDNANYDKWNRINSIFGGTRFRTLVQTYILRPLLNNANIYLERITDRYTLTCSEENEQLSILVLDRYNKGQVRSVTVLSGGERFMISLALSLALSSLNRQDMNINILFIDEGFGTLDETSLNSVMSTLERLQEIAGQTNRRVGIISHREELRERIQAKINVRRKGESRSVVEITNED